MNDAVAVTRMFFVRHAEPDMSVHDDHSRPLSEQGLRDRELAVSYLLKEEITAVYSSPYVRAMDTVAPLAQARGLRVQPVADFRERAVSHSWIEDFQGFCTRQWRDFSYMLPGGECLREVEERNIRALELLLERHRGETLAVGSHGTALSVIIHHYIPSYGQADFQRIVGLMPWVVLLEFHGQNLAEIQSIDIFKKELIQCWKLNA